MIYSLTGKVLKKSLDRVVLSCAGVGYLVQTPASVAGALPGVGGEGTLYTVMTVTENGFNETTSFPDISFSRKKLRDFVSMLERNDVSPVHVEEMIDDFFYAE